MWLGRCLPDLPPMVLFTTHPIEVLMNNHFPFGSFYPSKYPRSPLMVPFQQKKFSRLGNKDLPIHVTMFVHKQIQSEKITGRT